MNKNPPAVILLDIANYVGIMETLTKHDLMVHWSVIHQTIGLKKLPSQKESSVPTISFQG